MSDRCNRLATPLMEGRTHKGGAVERAAGAGRGVLDDLTGAIDVDPDLYTIFHDLKNQLAAIKGWSDLLQRRIEAGLDRAVILRDVATIRSSAEAMDELLAEVLDTGRIEMGHGKQRTLANVDLWALTEQRIEQQRALAEGHVFTLVGPGSGRVIGRWDAGSVERILTNLLSNAIKYSPSGGHITISVEQDGPEARLAVHDHGTGIPTTELSHIFEPFYRSGNVADQHGTPRIPGFGIGLFAARKLARLHNGRIEVTSTEQQGSTFTLVLPVRGYPQGDTTEQ